MKLLELYRWFIGTVSDFSKPFRENEELLNEARKFWRNLEANSWIIVLLFVVIGILMAVTYYTYWNNKPGRHYKPKDWIIYLVATFIICFLLTLGIVYFLCPPNLSGSFPLELKLALCNALYSIGVYLIVSFVWCNWLPTNAYRIFKI